MHQHGSMVLVFFNDLIAEGKFVHVRSTQFSWDNQNLFQIFNLFHARRTTLWYFKNSVLILLSNECRCSLCLTNFLIFKERYKIQLEVPFIISSRIYYCTLCYADIIMFVLFVQEDILLETNRNLRRKVKTCLIWSVCFNEI